MLNYATTKTEQRRANIHKANVAQLEHVAQTLVILRHFLEIFSSQFHLHIHIHTDILL